MFGGFVFFISSKVIPLIYTACKGFFLFCISLSFCMKSVSLVCMIGSNEEGVMINGDISEKLHRNKLADVSVPLLTTWFYVSVMQKG